MAETLLKLHQFFIKISPKIVESLCLLGKVTMYYRGEVIQENEHSPQPYRSPSDIGFLLYGKLELLNRAQFYSKQVHNWETLFEHRVIRRQEKYEYEGRVMEESMVLWVSR